MNALNINSSHSRTSSHNQPTWLPTQFYLCSLFSLYVELALHLLSPQLDHLYLPHYSLQITNRNRSFRHASPYLFIPSTSFCSLSSWFNSSWAYHLITVTNFALTICNSLSLSLQTWNSSLSEILSSIVFLFLPDGLHGSWTCTELTGHWRFCFSFMC